MLSNTADYRPNLRLGVHLINSKYALAKLHRQITLDPHILAAYVGRYELDPNFALTFRVDGNRLFVQATGQAEIEAFAESETEFFARVVDAQVTFDRPENGVAQSLVLHQNGKDRPGKRVP